MKIGILSMQRVINYGSVLQAYSLKNILENISEEEVEFIDIDRSEMVSIHGNVTTKADYTKSQYSIQSAPWLCIRKIKHKYLRKKYERSIKDFQNDTLKLTYQNKNKQYDLVVIGSDEVFIAVDHICLQLYGKVNNAKNIITYAAASGVAEYKNIGKDVLPEIQKALANIAHMSVRDVHTFNYISKMYQGVILEHVDPVLAGDLRFREHKKVSLQKYMVVYAYAERISNIEEIKAIKDFARRRNLKIVCIGGQQLWCDKFIVVDPLTMLDYFYNAEYVVTDTFHGTVFSIINRCRFAVLMRESNKYKIHDLLEKTETNRQLVDHLDNLPNILEQEIDYKKVDAILDKERKRCISYLEDCVKEYKE